MALNEARQFGDRWFLPVATAQAAGTFITYASGLFGGVLETAADANDQAWVRTSRRFGSWNLPTLAEDDMGAQAIAVGDIIYDDSGVLNVDAANGVAFGIALEANASGTNTIEVLVF